MCDLIAFFPGNIETNCGTVVAVVVVVTVDLLVVNLNGRYVLNWL